MADPLTWTQEATAAGDATAYAYDEANAAYYEAGGEQEAYDGVQAGEQAAGYEAGYDGGYDYDAGYEYGTGYEYGAEGEPLAVDWSDPNAYAGAYRAEGEASYFALEEADPNAPTSPFGDEAYWQQYGEVDSDATAAGMYQENGYAYPQDGEAYQESGYAYQQEAEAVLADPEAPADDNEDDGASPIVADPTTESSSATATSVVSTLPPGSAVGTPPSSSSSSKRKKKPKTKQERMEMRQRQLEKEEEGKDNGTPTDETASTVAGSKSGPGDGGAAPKVATKQRVETPPLSFLDRERAKLRLRLRQARAIAHKRMPIQIRILTEARRNLSPMEIYFDGSVETALSDIFWAATKGDLRRVKFLVEVEKVSVADCQFDPWQMEQTPLHWAAKGGHGDVVEYLLQAGASPRVLDETGSLPLHLACWAGHVDATLALLRATDTKDLYVRDYDAALAPLDWANLRGHTKLVKAIEKYEDSKWLPKFVEDLVRGIIRYKIKLFKEPPKGPKSPTRGINFRRTGAAAEASTPAATTDNQSNAPAETGKAGSTPAKSDKKTAPGPETVAQTKTK